MFNDKHNFNCIDNVQCSYSSPNGYQRGWITFILETYFWKGWIGIHPIAGYSKMMKNIKDNKGKKRINNMII
jgi:hypothetical protein